MGDKVNKVGEKIPPSYRKLDSKLRMIRNASFDVNRIRSELSASVAVKDQMDIEGKMIMRKQTAIPIKKSDLPDKESRGKLKKVTSDIYVSVFIELAPAHAEKAKRAFPGEIWRKRNMITANVPLSELEKLIDDPAVLHVEIGQKLELPIPKIENAYADEPDTDETKIYPDLPRDGGGGILIGIIDVQGFDFTHPDFLDENGKTRFQWIWDQGGDPRKAPGKFGYGAEITKNDMDDAIRDGPMIGVPPQRLEPQSQMVPGSHGTHVASIAAGNHGVCPRAYLVGVLISLAEEDFDRRKSFYDSTRIAHAVEYILDCAKKLEERSEEKIPVAINISLGTNGHAHDGSSAVNRFIDSELTIPGCCVCVAAGNAGQEKPETADDIGFIMGRIHTSGQIAAKGLDKDIEWVVVGNQIADISENELEIWYSSQDRFSVRVKPPGMNWTEVVKPGQFIENRQLQDGNFLNIYNELYHPSNGCNYISIYLSPFYTDSGIVGVSAGKWIVRLHGEDIRDGRYHGWIERDDPRRLGRVGPKEAWNFPSFFTVNSNVDNSSVNSLACGQLTIGVANMDSKTEEINITSSQGPTRDGRFKPEIAAPGTDVVAAKGFSNVGDEWISMSGTSMASPHVCGVAGLMLSKNKKLTAAQIIGIMMHTAKPSPGSDYTWRNDAGYGLIDPIKCLEEAEKIDEKEDIT